MAVPAPPLIVLLGLIGPMLLAFGAAILRRNFVHAVIAYATGSALLAALFGLLGAPFAAVVELTVGAGLIAVLFLVAITLTQGAEEGRDG